MFDLEKAISAWTHSLKHHDAITEEDKDELEAHVREQVADLVSTGMSTEQAFRQTMDEMGHPVAVDSEYRKVYWGKMRKRGTLSDALALRFAVLSNHFKTAWRSMMRHSVVSGINLIGLAVALAACVMIGFYVQDEFAFDSMHEKGDRIYRLGQQTVGWPYGRLIENEYPAVESVLYMRSYPSMSILQDGRYHFKNMLYAEQEFFRFFDFPVVEGDTTNALALPFNVVLSADFAAVLFGEESAVGRQLVLNDSLDATVTAVVELPRQSHIQFDALLSFATLRGLWGESGFDQAMSNGWLNLNVVNYVMLHENASAEALEAEIENMPMEYAGEMMRAYGVTDYKLGLEPLDALYLDSPYGNMLGPKSDSTYAYLLGGIALFLLLIAAANFVNLSTARSGQRAREIGIRKAVGSSRSTLVQQFLGESTLTALIAMVLAFGVVAIALPAFNALADRTYTLGDLISPWTLLLSIALVLFLGGLAGMYPAVSMSRFNPTVSLRGRSRELTGAAGLRKGLVVFQFAISVVLIVATLVVLQQVRFMQDSDLGFEAEQILVIDARRAPGDDYDGRIDAFKDALLAHPGIQAAGAGWTTPGSNGWRGQISFPEHWDEGQSMELEYIAVDHDYLSALELNFLAGRPFSRDYGTDASSAVIINEAAAVAAGWSTPEEAIGKGFASPGSGKPEGVVIGVVDNYHQHGLQESVEPIMFGIGPTNRVVLRIDPSQTRAVLGHVSDTWNRFFQGFPYDTAFLDEQFKAQYVEQERLAGIFATFSLLTIIVACLGMFGLAMFSVTRRTKEIGVRKALGATGMQIASLVTREFLLLVGVAFLVAVPVSWYVMRGWLDNFAFRMDMGPGLFVLTGLIVAGIAVITVSYQALKAASADPIDSLRYE